MKKLLTIIAICLSFGDISAQSVYVRSYFKSNGTFVFGHYRSKADGNFFNNYSTKPNINPYTGRVGTRVTPPRNYGLGSTFSKPSYVLPSIPSRPLYTAPRYRWKR